MGQVKRNVTHRHESRKSFRRLISFLRIIRLIFERSVKHVEHSRLSSPPPILSLHVPPVKGIGPPLYTSVIFRLFLLPIEEF